MTLNPEYRVAFEEAVLLMKLQQKRSLTKQETRQLNKHIAYCRQHERES